MQTDAQLLDAYAVHRSEAAFADLVNRYIDLVYSASLRIVCDAHLAEDVAQKVFIALAQNARQLSERAVLSGWLHCTTRNIASQVVRSEVRRRFREQEAVSMNPSLPQPEETWEAIAPHLDSALGELSDADRDAIMLRYFERKSAREMAAILGVSDEAAQRRVSRAVERLRELFARRGVTVGAGGLVLLLSANAVSSAPAGLALAIASASVAATTAAGASTVTTIATLTKAIAMTTLQKAALAAVLTAAVGVGIYQAHQTSTLRDEVQSLHQEQAPLADEIAELKRERDAATNQLALLREENTRLNRNTGELLRLRGQAAVARADAAELARLKSITSEQNNHFTDFLTNAMAVGLQTAEKSRWKNAQARLERMKKTLNLTEDQFQAITNITAQHIQAQTRLTMDLMSGKLATDERTALVQDKEQQELEIKALFTPEQLAAYPDYLKSETRLSAESSAKYDARRVAEQFGLSADQQKQLQAAFLELNVSQANASQADDELALAKRSGNYADAAKLRLDQEKARLDQRLQVLGNLLSPEQLESYRKDQMSQIALQEVAAKVLLPQQAADTSAK